MIETGNETDLKINAGSLQEIVMVALAVLVGHLGDVSGTVLAEVGGIQEMIGMKEVTGGTGTEIPGGVESKIETETGIVRESVIEIVTETGQGVGMMMIAGGQEMKMIEAGMEGEDGEEEIGPEMREVGVVVTVMSGGEGEGIVIVTENGTMIVSKSKTETGMGGGLVEVTATVTVIVIKVTTGGVEEIVTAIKNVIEEGGIGIGIKSETETEIEIGTVVMVGEVAIEMGTKIETEVGEIVME